MERSKYEVFLKVIEKGSFSCAAEELGYTPSGLNRMMSALENEIGFSVFNRNKKGVYLTEEGEHILPYVKKMMYWKDRLSEYIDEVKGLQTGNIRIGTIYSVASLWLPDMVHRFKNLYPKITVSILQGSHQELNKWLDEGKVDFIFTTKRGDVENWITLRKDPLVAWVKKTHPLAQNDSLKQSDISKEPFILTLAGENSDTEYLASSYHIKLDVQYTSRDSYTTYRMVEAGLGISINNLMMSQNWTGDVSILPLDPPVYVELGIHLPKIPTISTKKFIECVMDYRISEL